MIYCPLQRITRGARVRWLISAALSVMIVSMSGAAAVASKREVEAAFAKFMQGWNTRDIEAVVSQFTPDAVAFDPAPPGRFENTDGMRTWVTEAFKAYENLAIEIRDMRVATSGETAWLSGSYVLKGKMEGRAMHEPGFFSVVYVKQRDGSYKIPLFHASMVPQPR